MFNELDVNKKIDEEQRYEATWQYIRKWEGIFLTIAALLFIIFLFSISSSGRPTIVTFIAMGIFAVVIFAASRIRPICPRCGKEFFKLGLVKDGTLKKKCFHCGLPKGAPRDPDIWRD